MKIEIEITEEVDLHLATRVVGMIFTQVKKEIPGTKASDVIAPVELVRRPEWRLFIEGRIREAISDNVLADPDAVSIFPSELSVPFGVHLDQAREAANSRRVVKNKSIKLSAKDHGAAKRLLREHGIDFE